MKNNKTESWGSRYGFMLATAGSAIGLGNLWKFPYVTGMNGGGSFVLLYLICIFLVGLPVMVGELAVGRAVGGNTVAVFRKLLPPKSLFSDIIGGALLLLGFFMLFTPVNTGSAIISMIAGVLILTTGWIAVGIITGVVIPVLIMGYYGVIGGWTVIYLYKAVTGTLTCATPQEAAQAMSSVSAASDGMFWPVIIAQLLFSGGCFAVLLAGVRSGIERCSKVLMPMLFILLLVLIWRSVSLPGAVAGVRFFLEPDISRISAGSIIIAMGHAFFTLSLAMGIVMTYGSYLDKNTDLVKSTLTVIGLDLMAALMAGLAIFPAVFAMGFKPDAGPALLFNILPASFNQIPGGFGWIWNSIFFFAILIAALTSGISLMEPTIAVISGEFKLSRKVSVIITAVVVLILGTVTSISMTGWQHIPAIGKVFARLWPDNTPAHLFSALDYFSCSWLLPLAGLAMTIYIGWVWGTRHALKEIRRGASKRFDGNLLMLAAGLFQGNQKSLFSAAVMWGVIIRWVTPLLLTVAFLDCIGIIKLQ